MDLFRIMRVPFEGGCPRPSLESRRRTPCLSADREGALHSRLRMPRHGAEVGVLAFLLERDGELRCLAGLDQRCLLAVDLEVVQHVAGVLEAERDRAGPRNRLRRELEGEFLPA